MAPRRSLQRPVTRKWLRVLYIVLIVIGLYALLPQLSDFHTSFTFMKRTRLGYVGGVAAFSALTYVFAATTYCLLAVRRLAYVRTVLVELASMFVNRLLPAGIGGIGANYDYLRRSRHTGPQSAAIVAINNTLGFIGNIVLLVVLLLATPNALTSLHLPHVSRTAVVLVILVLVIGILFIVFRGRLHERLLSNLRHFWRQIIVYRHRKVLLFAALISSLCLTLSNVFGLWVSVRGVHGHLGFVPVLLVFSLGVTVGTAVPTPGGLGGVEAGLVGGLVAYHLDAGQALAAVLIYRFISYWLALFVGSGAFVLCRWRKYL